MVLVYYPSGNGTTPGRNREGRKVAGSSADGTTTSRVRAGRVCIVCNTMFAVFAPKNINASGSGGADELQNEAWK